MKRIWKRIKATLVATGRLLRRPFVWGLAAGVVLVLLLRAGNAVTSTDVFCESCHEPFTGLTVPATGGSTLVVSSYSVSK